MSEWQLRGCLGREWEWHVGPDKPWDGPGWLPARVPGSVLDDLVRAGEAVDPYFERRSRLDEWVPERSWVYRRRFDGEGGLLHFGGVDYACTVFVDGEEVARHEGCFVPFQVDLPAGRHLLAVVVHPAPESEPQVGVTSRVRVHKPRMNYGWDFCPRLVHQGIWRPVTLEPAVTLEQGGESELELRTVSFDDYELVVDGERVPVRGWNWVPMDALYGVPRPEKLAHLLELAARANVNLLRVWGGGLIETEEFYGHCDRLGLLVWQEFSMSSSGLESVPADDPEFVAMMTEQARAIVPLRRAHPSLALWCGGNELTVDDSTPVIAALRGVVEELDPGRSWLATSPYGDGADIHGPWEHQGLRRQYELYDTAKAKLHSEFGVEGMTNRRAHEALIAPEHRWPADRTNPVYEHVGAWWNNAPLVQECFGGRLDDLETLRRASQWLQYEGLRYAVEACRRRGCGTIPWQFNESFPNAWCTAAVDWHGDPKPAYWGVARAYRDRHASAQFATSAWGGEQEVRARLTAWGGAEAAAQIVRLDGTVVAEGGDEVAAPLGDLDDVFVLDLGCNRYVMTRTENLASLLDLEPARVEVDVDDEGVTLRNTGRVAALGIVLEDARRYDVPGWTLYEDNVLDLLPGEERRIAVEWPEERALRVGGWNVRA